MATPPRSHARLRRVLVAALLILGTCVGLLLAHSSDWQHSGSATASVTSADHGVVDEPAVSANPADLLAGYDSLALCLSIGIGCVIALLIAGLTFRRSPVLARGPSPQRTSPVRGSTRFTALSISLDTLCVSRV